MPRSNVVITGLGVVSSIGIGVEDYFNALLEKKSGIRSLAERTDEGARPGAVTDPPGLWIGGPVIDFDPKQHVRPRKALKVMCREIQTAFAAAHLATEHAELGEMLPADPDGPLSPQDIGTVFGSEMFYGPSSELQDGVMACMREDGSVNPGIYGEMAMKHVMPLWMLKYLPNMSACHVGISMNAHGPNNTLVLGDVSGPAAMIEAASCIERGIANVMVTGASGTLINTTRMNYRGDFPVPQVTDPISMSARPHDPKSVGVVGGEGAAALVLESRDHAAARNLTPIARFVSYASRFVPCDQMRQPQRTVAIDKPNLRGSQRAIRLAIDTALTDAQISADQLGLVVSHGTGDPITDAAEQAAIKGVIPESVPVVATIASLGHTGAACGLIDIATGAMALAQSTVPPTLRTDTTHAAIALLDQPQPMGGDFVLVLSHTAEGIAMAIVLGRPNTA